MQRMKISMLVLALGLACTMVATTRASLVAPLGSTQDRNDNQLQLRQLNVDNVTQIAPEGMTRQAYTCWQVVHGSWNGQNLDGLSLVMAKQVGEINGNPTHDRCIYVSQSATQAQRDALVAAVSAANPAWFAGLKDIRVEPAAIEVEELDGNICVLHIGRIA